MKPVILVVDDDPRIINMLKRNLAYEEYTVVTAHNGREALEAVERDAPDLIILDVMLPDLDGWEICRRIKADYKSLPVLMLTAKDEVENRVKGLDLGADDYVIKPFALDELLARIRAQLRRNNRMKEEGSVIRYAEISLNLDTRRAWRGEREISLKGKEFEILALFTNHPRQVLAKETIIERVWGADYRGESNVVEVYIASLRQKLEEQSEPRLIHTVRGVGYVMRRE